MQAKKINHLGEIIESSDGDASEESSQLSDNNSFSYLEKANEYVHFEVKTKTITFVHANLLYLKTKRKWRIEPTIYSKLRWLIPDDINCKLIDARIEEINFDEPTDMVVMSISTLTARSAYLIAEEYKKRGIPVLMGGCHVQLCPEEALEHADTIALGEAEIIWKDICEDFKQGKLRRVYKCDGQRYDMLGIKSDRSIFKKYHYFPGSLVETTRGCKFKCEFCSYAPIYKQSIVYRPTDDVVEEMRQNKNKFFYFIDENFGNDFEYTKELAQKMIPLKKKWMAQISVNALQDEKFVELLAKSGCWCLFIGFETTNVETLKEMNKMSNLKKDSYDIVFENCMKHNITVAGGFVVGSDADTRESIDKTYEFASKYQILFCNFVNILPYPGTPFYERLKQENRLIFDKWWLADIAPYHNALFITKHFSAEEMSHLGYDYIKRYYSWREMFRRFFKSKYRMHMRLFILFGNIFLKYFYIDITA